MSELMRRAEALNRYFVSGNSVPVEKALIRAAEWNSFYAMLLSSVSEDDAAVLVLSRKPAPTGGA